MLEPILDHAVVDVRDGIDDAAERFRRLGFTLSARGHHNLGSSNHLAVFSSNYLEVFGWERGAKLQRPDIQRYPVGLGGLVFRAHDADTVSATLSNAGLAAHPPASLSRPVQLPNGAQVEARFRIVLFDFGTFGWTRTYFCEHFTPELVWRTRSEQHANGALDIVRVVIQAQRPDRLGTLFATMFGEASMRLDGETCTLVAGSARIEIMQPQEVNRIFGSAAADSHGRDETMVALSIRTSALQTAAEALRAGGIEIQEDDDRIVVPAPSAMNATLEFVP